MNRILLIVLALLVVALPVVYITVARVTVMYSTGDGTRNEAILLLGDTTIVRAEISDSDIERERGLSGRDRLGETEGMLFLFDQPGRPVFWMKEMNFPIDIIWINGEMVVAVDQNIPSPSPGDGELPVFRAETDVDRVLEVNAGFVDDHGVSVGDRLDIRLP
jgi:hypothetical protein